MEAVGQEPTTLLEAVPYFQNPDNCIAYLAKRRWPNGVECPKCGRKDAAYVPSRRYWQCKTRHAKAQFSVKVGTIFEESPIGLDKWLPVMWQVANCKNGVSSCEISRNLGVTQKTSWFMLHRIRLAMQDENTGGKLAGELEADESFLGGQARNMHKSVRARVLNTRKKKDVQALVREHAESGSNLYTGALKSYEGLDEFTHQVIDHTEAYVNDKSTLTAARISGRS